MSMCVRWSLMETVLVSGGSGCLGGCCVVELLRRGYGVRTTVRDLAKEGEVRALGWEPRPVEETIADCGRSLAA